MAAQELTEGPVLPLDEQDRKLRRSLTTTHVAAMTFSAMIGSGWLFAAYYSAGTAGPAALISWGIGGLFSAVTALVFIELAIGYPISGGLVRWPQLAGGPFIGALAGWATIAIIVVGGAVESSGIFQYVSRWWPALFDPRAGQLTWTGIGMCCVAIAVFTSLNLLAIKYVSALNVVLSIAKWAIPLLTAALLIASGFHGSNMTGAHSGGFMPYGPSSVLSVVTSGGILFTLGGFYIAQTVAGEVKDPRRTQARGTAIGALSAFAVYLALQLAFIGALPPGLLAHGGWHGISFSSPFAQLAALVNLGWLSTVLVVDAVLSPSASALIGTAMFGRNIYGMAQNRTLPDSFRSVGRNGVPLRALVLSAVLSIVSLVVLRSWHSIVALLGAYFAFGYATASLALGVFLRTSGWRTWCRGMHVISYANFVLAGLIMYWDGWDSNRFALGSLAAFAPVWFLLHRMAPEHHTLESVRLGAWFLAWVTVTFALSYAGAAAFQGRDWIGQPWDTVIAGVLALIAYPIGVANGTTWARRHGLTGTPARLRQQADSMLGHGRAECPVN